MDSVGSVRAPQRAWRHRLEAASVEVPPDKHTKQTGDDKVHARHSPARFRGSGFALQVRQAAADLGR